METPIIIEKLLDEAQQLSGRKKTNYTRAATLLARCGLLEFRSIDKFK